MWENTGKFQEKTSTTRNMSGAQSLINYMPSSLGGSFKASSSTSGSEEEYKEPEQISRIERDLCCEEDDDERCRELWSAIKYAAGPWLTYRFNYDAWDTPKELEEPEELHEAETLLEHFDGVLTKEILVPNLSRVDRCPEFQRYAYTKCVLIKKSLTNIDLLKSYQYLQYIDVSSNHLTSLKPLGNLPFLKILDASHNLLTSILDFKAPYYLTKVNLSHNKIKLMRNLTDFWSVVALNLSHNLIKVIEGLQELKYLSVLNLSSNKIQAIRNIGSMRLQFLYLQNNNIKLRENDEEAELHTLKYIRTINLNCNQVSSLKMFEPMKNLECLEVANNNISKLLDIYYLRNLKYLNKLNLSGNPVCQNRRYIEVCITHLQNLVELDEEQLNLDILVEKLSETTTDMTIAATSTRLKLLALEQMNPPKIWPWLLPYDSSPFAVIVLVGLAGSNRAYLAKKFCTDYQRFVVVGIPYTTKPKHKDEVDGDFFYYVDQDKFMTMLKNGEFVTYQENLGTYYGIAHSEFKKAVNGIIMFYTDLTMALAIRRQMLTTILVLSLPSTIEEHLARLKTLFAVNLIDKDTFRIINSPLAAAEYRLEFQREKHKLLAGEVHDLIKNIVKTSVKLSEASTHAKEQNNILMVQSLKSPSKASVELGSINDSVPSQSKSNMFHLWWASTPTTSLSMVIQPLHTEGGSPSKTHLDPFSKAAFQAVENSVQMKRLFSFSGAQVDQISNIDDVSQTELEVSETVAQEDLNKEASKSDEFEQQESHIILPARTSYFSQKILSGHECYNDIILQDGKVKAFFDEELRQREELLELHLEMPGFFREMLFTDKEDEAMAKLSTLVKDIGRYKESCSTEILNFDKDKNFTRLTNNKINSYFEELKKDISISDKQADEFLVHTRTVARACGESCTEPTCPTW